MKFEEISATMPWTAKGTAKGGTTTRPSGGDGEGDGGTNNPGPGKP